jgi:putative Mn2+ efflux pump MntP
MLELTTLALTLSLDNVWLAGAIAAAEPSARRYWRVAAIIAAVEGLFPLLGAAAAALAVDVSRVDIIGPPMMVAAISLSIVGALMGRRIDVRRTLYMFPVCYGLDNLAAGAALGFDQAHMVGQTLLVGAVSGTISLVTMMAVARCVAPLHARWSGHVQNV